MKTTVFAATESAKKRLPEYLEKKQKERCGKKTGCAVCALKTVPAGVKPETEKKQNKTSDLEG
jgi:hypothetical protein